MATKATFLLVSGLTAVAIGAGCSGAKSYVRADQSAFPISLSDGLRGSDGQLVADARKSSVGTFEAQWSSWTLLWTLIPLSNRTRDISAVVNDQVKKAGGDAIVGLDVKVTQCGWNYLTILGILPGCDHVSVTGHIVKVAAAQ